MALENIRLFNLFRDDFHVLFCFRGAKAAIIVYDITRAESFEKAKFWINEIRKQVEENIVIALAGNKVDLENLR